MCQSTGPTIYDKKYLTSENVECLAITCRLKKCTETRARRVIETDNWTVMLDEFYPFIGILYA